jgi:hypothetical protein
MHDHGAAQAAAAFRSFGLAQMSPASLMAQYLAARRDLEPLGHRLFGFNAFGTSHKNNISFLPKKSAHHSGPAESCKMFFEISDCR